MAEYISSDTMIVGKGDVLFNLDNYPLACPEKGSFVGYKIGLSPRYLPCLIILKIPADAKRSSTYGRKCRCDKAQVLDILEYGTRKVTSAVSWYDHSFIYHVGAEVSASDFDENRWHECAPGIHFFMTKKEALDYWG